MQKSQIQSQISKEQTQIILPTTYFHLIQKVGSGGKYQSVLLLVFALIWYVSGNLFLSTAFLYLNPSFDCPFYGLLVENCQDYVCSLSSYQWSDFITQNSRDFKSLANSFNQRFYCSDEVYLNIYSSLIYLGAMIGYIVISFYADNRGRKNITILGWAISVLGIILALAAPNITVASIGMLLAGIGTDSATNITLIFIVEVFEDNLRQKSMTAVQISFCVGAMTATIFYYIFQDWWITTLLSILIPSFIVLILMVVFVQQSPMFLLLQGVDNTYKIMNKIGKMNTGRYECVSKEDIENVILMEQVIQFKEIITFFDLFYFKSLRIITFFSGFAYVATYIMYFGPILIIGQIGFDIYTTNLVLNVSELLSFVPLVFIIDKLKRKKAGIILMGTASLISGMFGLIVTLSDDNKSSSMLTIELIVVFLFRFCIAMQFSIFLIYTNQLYPTRARSIGCGMLGVLGTITSTLSPYMMGALKRNHLNPFILFAVVGLLGTASYSFLRQTHQQNIPDQIEEILQDKMRRSSCSEKDRQKKSKLG